MSLSKILVWTLLGLAVIGLLGFGSVGLSGRANSLGTVGEQDLSAAIYRAEVRSEQNTARMMGLNIQPGTATDQALRQQVLGRMIGDATISGEAEKLGLSVSDAVLAETLRSASSFQGLSGEFDPVRYNDLLRSTGLSAPEYEENLRKNLVQSMMLEAARGGIAETDTLSTLLNDFTFEQRDFTITRVDAASIDAPEAPEDTVLQSFYEAQIADYTIPNRKQITYVWLTPAMLQDTMTLDDAALRDLYEQNLNRYVRPERRLVERLPYRNTEAAEAARAELESGDASFEDLVEARGLTLIDVDMGDVTEADLEAAGATVFATEPGQVTQVLDSPLGPALFRVNAVLPATEQSFEDVREDLIEELSAERARREILQSREFFENELAAGVTLEELAEGSALQIGQIEWYPGTDEGLAAYDDFGAVAAGVALDDLPSFAPLADGGVFALRMDAQLSAEPRPIDDVRERVLADWQLAEQLRLARQMIEQGADTDTAETEMITDLRRGEHLDGVPDELVDQAFTLNEGDVTYFTGESAAWRLEVVAINAADPNDEEVTRQLERIKSAVMLSMAGDFEQIMVEALQSDIEIRLNAQVIAEIDRQTAQ